MTAGRLRASVLLALAGGASAGTRLVATWTFSQPKITSSWAQWTFARAGNFSIPSSWNNPVVSWSFDGGAEVSYVDQASLGAVCYEPVPPTTPLYTHVSVSQQCSADKDVDYAVGFWLWSGASSLGGAWTVSVEYTLPDPPPPPSPFPPPPTGPGAPLPGTAFSTLSAWLPTSVTFTSDGCVSGPPARCTLTSGSTADAMVYSTLPSTFVSPPAMSWIGVFFTQSHNFTCTGVPAVVGVYNTTKAVWMQNLPNTPSGESCQNAGGECPSCGLSMAPRAQATIALAPSNANTVRTGFSPTTANSWGTSSFQGTITFSPSRASAIRRIRVPQPKTWNPPGGWNTSWTDWKSAHASAHADAAAFYSSKCAVPYAEAHFGWVPAGTASIAMRSAWTASALSTLTAAFYVNGNLVSTSAVAFLGATTFGLYADSLSASAAVHEGYLSVRLSVASTTCATSNVIVTDVAAQVTATPPSSPFVVSASAGQCLRAMRPLRTGAPV